MNKIHSDTSTLSPWADITNIFLNARELVFVADGIEHTGAFIMYEENGKVTFVLPKQAGRPKKWVSPEDKLAADLKAAEKADKEAEKAAAEKKAADAKAVAAEAAALAKEAEKAVA